MTSSQSAGPITLLAATLVATLVFASRARADDPAEDAPLWQEHPGRAEQAEAEAAPPVDLWLGVSGHLALDGALTRAGGMLVLGGKLDAPLKQPAVTSAAPALAKAAPTQQPAQPEPSAGPRRAEPPGALAPLRDRPRLGALALGAVRAALAAARSTRVEERLSDAATRARASGLVPELRLRVAHVLDEDQRLAPTEYDPERVTASGGTSLWLEARATFRLERLVFADDELAIERLRADRAKLEAELASDVLKSFELWQRAEATLASELADDEQRAAADVDAAVAEARLDALTDGWFSSRPADSAAPGGAPDQR